MFGNISDYIGAYFDVDSLSFAYSTSNKAYISVAKKNTNVEYVVNKIVDIKENNDVLTIDALIGIIKNDKLYSVLNLESELAEYKKGSDLSLYKDDLTEIQYRFKKIDGKYYIDAISRK